jgi:uncharacterized repeat protein (TIGR01451 family)
VDVALSGTGTAPEITVTPTSLAFGDRDVDDGATASQAVDITNDGSADLHISSVSLTGANTGQFAITSDTGESTLSPGGTRTVRVAFNPATTGAKSAALTILSDDGDEGTVDVALSGTGTDQDLEVKALPDHLFANGVDESLLRVKGPGYAGQVVTLTWSLSYYPSPVTVTLDANGIATYDYVAGNVPGDDVITAIVYDAEEEIFKTATDTIYLDTSPLLGDLASTYYGRLITYTFILTNVSPLSDTNVVMTGSIPVDTELVWSSSGISFGAGGDYDHGYVSSPTYPVMEPDETFVLSWSVRTLRLTGDVDNQAHARGDRNILRLSLRDYIYRYLLPLVSRNAEL